MKYISKLNQCDLNEMLVYYYLLDHRTSEAALISQSQEEVDSCVSKQIYCTTVRPHPYDKVLIFCTCYSLRSLCCIKEK